VWQYRPERCAVVSDPQNGGTGVVTDTAINCLDTLIVCQFAQRAHEIAGRLGLSKWCPRQRGEKAHQQHARTPHRDASNAHFLWRALLQSRPNGSEAGRGGHTATGEHRKPLDEAGTGARSAACGAAASQHRLESDPRSAMSWAPAPFCWSCQTYPLVEARIRSQIRNVGLLQTCKAFGANFGAQNRLDPNFFDRGVLNLSDAIRKQSRNGQQTNALLRALGQIASFVNAHGITDDS
jgi:hypothetical protein